MLGERYFSWNRAYPWILAIIVIFLFWPLASMNFSMRWDATNIYLPWKYHITECLKQGLLPLWNPSMHCGFPQMGDPGTWYPLSWIIGFLFTRYDFYALNLEYLLHVFIGGIGFYQVARIYFKTPQTSLIMATSYMLSGFFISQAQHIGWIVSAAWIPWCYAGTIHLAKQINIRRAFQVSMLLFLLFTGGYPGLTIVTAYILLFAFIFHFLSHHNKTGRKFPHGYWPILLVPVLFVFMSLPAMIGSRELFSAVTRGSSLGASGAMAYDFGSLSPSGLISLLFPYALSTEHFKFWVEDVTLLNTYFGLLPLALIFLVFTRKGQSRPVLVFISIGVFFLLVSMATTFPLRTWLYHGLPLMDLFRFPSLFRLFAIFFFLLAAGLILEKVWSEEIERKKILIVLTAFLGLQIIILLILIPHVSFKAVFSFFTSAKEFMLSGSIPEKIFLQGGMHIILIILTLLVFSIKKAKAHLRWLVFLIVLLDMGISVRLNFFATLADPSMLRPGIEAFRQLPIEFPHPSLTQPMNEITDQRYYHTLPLSWRNVPVFHKIPSPEAYNPYTLQTTRDAMNSGVFDQAIQNPILFLLQGKEVVTPLSAKPSSVIIKEYSPLKLVVDVCLEDDAQLIYLQNTYPRWHATVDDKETIILPYLGTFMAIDLSPGQHRVSFAFEAYDIQVAFIMSLALLLIGLLIIFIPKIMSLPGNQRMVHIMVLISCTMALVAITVIQVNQRKKGSETLEEAGRMLTRLQEEAIYQGKIRVIINSDQSREDDHGSRMVTTDFLRIHNDPDYCLLDEVLRNDTSKYLLYSQCNVPVLKMIRPLIQHYYPIILEEKDHGHSWTVLARKAFRADTMKHAFPPGKSDIFKDTNLEDFLLDSLRSYSASLIWAWEDIIKASGGKFRLSCQMLANPGADPGIILQTETRGAVVTWQMESLGKYNCKPGSVVPVNYEFDLRQIKQPGDSVRIYFWSNNDIPAHISRIHFSP